MHGLFYRTVHFLNQSIKPVWVFDGTPPKSKQATIDKRKKVKERAEEAYNDAMDQGDLERAKKMSQRKIKVTPQMVNDAKTLVKLLGVPYTEAPTEAEAQCAQLCKKGLAYAVASEDMDSLAFGAQHLLRGFKNKNEPIVQISLLEILKSLDITMDMFVDLCILSGCDFTGTIKGIGPITALKFIKENMCIENVVDIIKKSDSGKFSIPSTFDYNICRKIFKTEEPCNAELNWIMPDFDALHEFLVNEKGMPEIKYQGGIKKLIANYPLILKQDIEFSLPKIAPKVKKTKISANKKAL